jgi:hypothetical protein
VGYCRSGTLQDDHLIILPGRTRHLRRLRCYGHGLVQQREAVAAGDRQVRHRGREQAARGQQERHGGQEGGGVHSGQGEGVQALAYRPKACWLILSVTGICRQPGHSFPGDIGQEREQCRASIPHHGTPNQGADGHYRNQQHQTERIGWTRSGCLEQGQPVLLDLRVGRLRVRSC